MVLLLVLLDMLLTQVLYYTFSDILFINYFLLRRGVHFFPPGKNKYLWKKAHPEASLLERE